MLMPAATAGAGTFLGEPDHFSFLKSSGERSITLWPTGLAAHSSLSASEASKSRFAAR